MTSCDLCGKTASGRARIEGVILATCDSCAALGTSLVPPTMQGRPSPATNSRAPHASQYTSMTEETELTPDFGKRLRTARQRMQLSEKDVALKLNLKESTLLHFEAGKVKPDDATVRKLEKFFSISLRE